MKREKLQQLGHLTAGIITLIYGFDSLESGDFSAATYYLSFAIIFLVIAGSHTWISQKFSKADVVFYLAEATAIGYSGWHYKLKGHTYLFYTMAVAGMVYFIFAIISFFFNGKTGHRSRRRKKRRHSSSAAHQHKSANDNNNLN